jgi:hypothetical protein
VGEVIGLIGDTGVKHSAAHLHFTLSVRPAVSVSEKYVDPEPLIALWPLRIAVPESNALVTAQAAPGVPLGAAHRRRRLRRPVGEGPSPAEADAAAAVAE